MKENLTINQRILFLVNSLGIQHQKFADKVGIGKGTLSGVLTKDSKPSYKVIRGILEAFPNLNPKWLILGEEPTWLEEKGEHQSETQQAPRDEEELGELKNAAFLNRLLTERNRLIKALESENASLRAHIETLKNLKK